MPLTHDAIDSLAAAYAALNRGDVPAFVSIFDKDIVRIEPADFPMAGTYRGIEAVTRHITQGRGTWAQGACEPTRFTVVGERVIVHIHVHVRLKTETTWREGDIADVFTFRDGKVIEFRTCGSDAEALAYVGDQTTECK